MAIAKAKSYAEVDLAANVETAEVSACAEKIRQQLNGVVIARVVAVLRNATTTGRQAIRIYASSGDLDLALDEIFGIIAKTGAFDNL